MRYIYISLYYLSVFIIYIYVGSFCALCIYLVLFMLFICLFFLRVEHVSRTYSGTLIMPIMHANYF